MVTASVNYWGVAVDRDSGYDVPGEAVTMTWEELAAVLAKVADHVREAQFPHVAEMVRRGAAGVRAIQAVGECNGCAIEMA